MRYSILVIGESNCGLRTKIVSALTKEGFKASSPTLGFRGLYKDCQLKFCNGGAL